MDKQIENETEKTEASKRSQEMKEVGKVGIRPRRSAEESRVRQRIEEEEKEESVRTPTEETA